MDGHGILGEGKINDEIKSLPTVGKPRESRNNSVSDIDISTNLPARKPAAEESTERFVKRLVDYDDDGRTNSEDEPTSAPSSFRRRTIQKKALRQSDGTRSGQRSRKHRPEELSRSYSRKRRHSPSTSSADERESLDDSEHPEESTFDVETRSEITPNADDRSSSPTTGLKVLKNSDKKFSNFCSADLRPHTTEKRERKWEDFDGSESQTTRRDLTPSTPTTLKILGADESTDRARNSEVERKLKAKALASTARSRSYNHENLKTEEKELSDDEELKRRESRRPRDFLQSDISSRGKSSSQRTRSSAKTFSPDRYRSRSRLKQGPRTSSPRRAATPDHRRSPESRRSEAHKGGETELRRSESRRRSDEGPDDFESGKGRLEKARRRSRASSDRNTTGHILDETRNAAVSKSAGTGSRSATNRAEQSGKTRSRSSTAYDDASNRQSSRRPSSASKSFQSCPEESCFRPGHGRRSKTRHADTPSTSGSHRGGGDESGTTRPSGSGKVSSPEGAKRTGEGRGARPPSSRDRTDASDHCSHNDNYHPGGNYYPNGWLWSARAPGHLKEPPHPPHPYPFPYLHPFAQPFASPMLRSVSDMCTSASLIYVLI